MAEAAIARGYEFLAITDHSKSQAIANGLSVERLLAHVKEIRKVADRLKKIKLLAGSEVDILVDGRLDYEDAVLKELDFVVASPHVSLKQDEAKATDRIVRAIENRYVNVIGHPRPADQRTAGLTLNFKRFTSRPDRAALEINAGWPRLTRTTSTLRATCRRDAVDQHRRAIQQFDGIGLGFSVAGGR
jgi:DNA polymerase (family 10)